MDVGSTRQGPDPTRAAVITSPISACDSGSASLPARCGRFSASGLQRWPQAHTAVAVFGLEEGLGLGIRPLNHPFDEGQVE